MRQIPCTHRQIRGGIKGSDSTVGEAAGTSTGEATAAAGTGEAAAAAGAGTGEAAATTGASTGEAAAATGTNTGEAAAAGTSTGEAATATGTGEATAAAMSTTTEKPPVDSKNDNEDIAAYTEAEGQEVPAEGQNNNEATEKPGVPTELKWDADKVGRITFKHNVANVAEGQSLHYYIDVYKDGEPKDINWEYSIRPIKDNPDYCQALLAFAPNYNFTEHKTESFRYGLTEPGKYKFMLKVRKSDDNTELVSAPSEEYEYTKPTEELKLQAPKNVRWSNDGTLEWDAVEGASYYFVKCLVSGSSVQSFDTEKTKIDLSSMKGNPLVAVVVAKGEKDKFFFYSDYSAEVSNSGSNTKPEASNSSNNSSSESRSSSDSDSDSSPSPAAPKEKAPMIGQSEGWKGLEKEVNEAMAKAQNGTGAVVMVKLNDVEIIPKSALDVAAGKDVTLSFMTKTGVIVNINGNALNPGAVGNISISSGKDKNGNDTLKIRNASSDLSKPTAIFMKANTAKTLYFIDAANTLIPFGTSNVAENGYVGFAVPFVSANYIIQ